MGQITIKFNGDLNLPIDSQHKTRQGIHKCERVFQSEEKAMIFWLECEFYSGAITPLDKIIKNGKEVQSILRELPKESHEKLLDSQKELYNLSEEDGLESLL